MRVNRQVYERGQILQVLAQNRAIELPIEFGLLLRTLDTLGVSLSAHDLRDRLQYLAEKAYVILQRRRDLKGFRLDRTPRGSDRPDDIVCVKLAAKGLDLAEGTIAADPGVQF